MASRIIWMDSKLQEVSNKTKFAQIRVWMTKLGPWEVGSAKHGV